MIRWNIDRSLFEDHPPGNTNLMQKFHPVRSLLITAAIACFTTLPTIANAQFLGWHNNLNAAAKVSAKTGKPLFVVFRCVR
jgi:hypothetical protein